MEGAAAVAELVAAAELLAAVVVVGLPLELALVAAARMDRGLGPAALGHCTPLGLRMRICPRLGLLGTAATAEVSRLPMAICWGEVEAAARLPRLGDR